MLENILSSPEAQAHILSMIAINGLKAAVVILLALAIVSAVRRTAAAYQHLILCLAMTAVLLLPALSLAFPSWEWSLFAGLAPDWSVMTLVTYDTSIVVSDPPSPQYILPAWALWAAAIWLTGVLLILLRIGLGFLATSRIVRNAILLEDSKLTDTVTRLCRRLDIRRSVRIVSSNRVATPFAWGIIRPVIILPADSCKWPQRDMHFALLHELAHIRRHDVVWHNVAAFVSAVHWMNPLIWIARKRLVIEAEKSCDDYVICEGKNTTEYAQHLLAVLRSMKSDRRAVPVGVCMARRSQMEGRLMSILSNRKRSTGLSRSFITGIAIATVLLVLPLAGLQLQAADDGKQVKKVDSEKEVFPSPDEKVEFDIAPEMKSQTTPGYPEEAKKAGITGVVWVQVLIDKEGKVRDVRIHKSSGVESLDKAAMKAAYKNEFTPAMKDGEPVAVWVTYKISFELDEHQAKDNPDRG